MQSTAKMCAVKSVLVFAVMLAGLCKGKTRPLYYLLIDFMPLQSVKISCSKICEWRFNVVKPCHMHVQLLTLFSGTHAQQPRMEKNPANVGPSPLVYSVDSVHVSLDGAHSRPGTNLALHFVQQFCGTFCTDAS